MQQARTFGALATPVPVIGIGTWNMERDPRPAVVAAIRRALDLGATHVDTAELYGRGKVEHMVGEAIAGRRDEVFLVSKVLPGNATRAGVPKACEASLRRLGTDHLDSYLLHWWEGELPLEDTFAAFQRLVEQGKIRSWGVSNFDVDELEHALSIVGPGLIACNQVLYHLGQRAIERAVLPFCEANGITVGRLPRARQPGWPGARRHRRRPPGHAPPGRARLPHPPTQPARHPKVQPRGGGRGEQRRKSFKLERF